jgi:hypothetical protein
VSDSVVGPPHADLTTQLLHSEENLLHLRAVYEPKLALDHPKPVVGLERLSCIGEERRMSGREVAVSGRSWSGSISCPIATMSRVGHELPQQLSLLVVRLEDRGDDLSQGRWQRWVWPIRLRGLGISPSIMSVHHFVIQTSGH